MSILIDYKIKFGVKKHFNQEDKFMKSINPVLDGLIIEFYTVSRCDQLLNALDQMINNSQLGENWFQTQGMILIKIKHSTTSIFEDPQEFDLNPNGNGDYTLPTTDFREIVRAWKNFVSNGNLGLLT